MGAEEERLKAKIKQYDDVSAKVNKYKQLKYKNGKLRVVLLRATDIEDKDHSLRKGDYSDVLVKFTVKGNKPRKSTIIKDSKNPIWKNQEFVFNVENPLKARLMCAVMDHDTMVNDFIGNVEIDIIDIVQANNACIKDSKYKIKGSKKGCLYLDLTYFEN